MSAIIQANCSWSKTAGETDFWQNVWTQVNSPQDNSPRIKLTLKQLAPESEANSPNIIILYNVLKFYSPQLDINLADRFLNAHLIIYFRANHLSAVSFEDNPLLNQGILSAFVLEIIGRRKIKFINLLTQ